MQVTIDVSKHQMDILAGLFKEMKIPFAKNNHEMDTEMEYQRKVDENLSRMISEMDTQDVLSNDEADIFHNELKNISKNKKVKILGIKKSKELIDKYLQS